MRLTVWLMVLVCATTLLVLAQDDTDHGVQSKIIALEKAWNQAYKLGDKRALDAILDDDIWRLSADQSRVSGQHNCVQLLRAAGRARIDERTRVRKYCHRNRSISCQGGRRRETLCAAGAFR